MIAQLPKTPEQLKRDAAIAKVKAIIKSLNKEELSALRVLLMLTR